MQHTCILHPRKTGVKDTIAVQFYCIFPRRPRHDARIARMPRPGPQWRICNCYACKFYSLLQDQGLDETRRDSIPPPSRRRSARTKTKLIPRNQASKKYLQHSLRNRNAKSFPAPNYSGSDRKPTARRRMNVISDDSFICHIVFLVVVVCTCQEIRVIIMACLSFGVVLIEFYLTTVLIIFLQKWTLYM